MAENGAELAGKVLLVTGAAGGIGQATARAFVGAGASVVVADLPGTALDEFAASLGTAAVGCEVDIADEASVRSLVAFVLETFGRLDGVDNNAGATGEGVDVLSLDAVTWDEIMAVNGRGTMLVCKHGIQAMLASGGGSIVNISSGASLTGDLVNAAYSSSKASVNQLTRHIATAFGGRGIRCNAIAPGVISTPTLERLMPKPIRDLMVANCLIPRLGEPSDIANAVAFLMSERAAYITGQVICVDGGFLAHQPATAAIRQSEVAP